MGTAVRVSGLTKRLGRTQALAGVDLRVETGRVHGLLGPNGAGKTTLLKTITGLSRPDSGSLELFGAPFTRGVLRDVGALVTQPGLWSRYTAVEHLRLHARLRGADPALIPRLLADVGMADHADRRVSAYSLGMRWRLGIAITLLARPRLLVLDEPTNGLDPVGMRDMRALLRRLAADGVAVLVSSHHLDQIAQTCDEVTVLVGGTVRFAGPLDGLAWDGDLEKGFFALLDRG
ncbi:ATP-binding cassette domain-containing protein [Streptomonospora sp. S1-112]|uniref:ATP-binding cassette domain-containing protein n=1 Tax=Streptomonospora mangrovi TaxID=2883123 RepID=A0A9X3NK40_9ACTN|nr:ATP-binding cassette domain-containing protein [Streptomonospora mangrovi]MDA0563598.1 ATP-binding cassette domain-containing protein [Streptomonospora mangrovi]